MSAAANSVWRCVVSYLLAWVLSSYIHPRLEEEEGGGGYVCCCPEGREKGCTHTWTLVVLRVPLGSRVENTSDNAINAATTKATVVKKPKAFWALTREVYMVGGHSEVGPWFR